MDEERGRIDSESSPETDRMNRFFEAFRYLQDHRIFEADPEREGEMRSCFLDWLQIGVIKVNPETHDIDTDSSQNTLVEVELVVRPNAYLLNREENLRRLFSSGPVLFSYGGTFEDAVIELAGKVRDEYDQPLQPQESQPSL